MKCKFDRLRGWYSVDGVHAVGYLFDEHGVLHQGPQCALHFAGVKTAEQLQEKLFSANGSFAVVLNGPESKAIATDRLRSIPLFYAWSGADWIVGDDAFSIAKSRSAPFKLCDQSVSEFLFSGFVFGKNTLLDELHQVRNSELVEFTGQSAYCTTYYRHTEPIRKITSHADEFSRLEQITRNWVARLIESTKGRMLILLLSGGYDLRYIAAALAEHSNPPPMLAYTYGRPDSPEVQRSRLVAERLEIPWHFVNYGATRSNSEMLSSEDASRYNTFCHQLSSLPHYQEYIALKSLTERGIIEPGSIVVPGFCGDFLGGSYVPNEVHFGDERKMLRAGIERHIIDQQL